VDRKILKNSSWILLAQSLVKVVSFFYTLFLARSLGVENFGYFVAALAYFSLFSSLADFGFNRFLVRVGARESFRLPEILASTLLLRAVLSTGLLAIFSVLIYLIDKDITRVNLSLLAVLAVIPQSMALTFDGVLVAVQKLSYSALGLLTLSVATTVIGIYLVSGGYSTYGAVSALILGQMTYLLVNFLLVSHRRIGLNVKVNLKILKEVTLGSLPYGILGVLGLLYFRIDSLMLSYLKGSIETGIYGVAYRFLEAIIFVPSAFAAALFPVLAKLEGQTQNIKIIYLSALKTFGALAILVTISYFFVIPEVIKQFLPRYSGSVEVIKILSLTIPFMFLHIPGAMVLISTDKYLRPVIKLSLVTLFFNVVLNLILIPKMGVIGASWVTVLSEALSFIVFFLLLYKKILRHG